MGYATQKELERDLVQGDMFAIEEFKAMVNEEMDKVARTYDIFKDVQLKQSEDMAHGRNQKTFPNHPTFPVRIKFPCYLSSRPVRPVNAPLRKHRTPFLRSRPPRRRPRCSALGALLSPRASPGRYPLPMPLFSCRPRFGHLKRAKARWIPKGGSS